MTQICKYFGECGGCDLQNLGEQEYYSLKQGMAAKIAQNLCGSEEFVKNIKQIGWNNRRRVEFKISKNKDAINLGFFKKQSHEVVDIDNCPLLCESINEHIADFKSIIKSLKKSGLIKALSVTFSNDYLDLVIHTKNDLLAKDKDKIIENCANISIIKRVSLKTENPDSDDSNHCDHDIIYKTAPFTINFADIEVDLPVNAFLQATNVAQNFITEIILNNISQNDKVIDLFCGCGTYSFPLLAKASTVKGYEGNYEMVMAANKAAIKNNLESKISFEKQDLFKNPVNPDQLKLYDVAVINPPRNGGLNQIKKISKVKTKKVIMVSCNPKTFQRDAKILIDEGYKLQQLHPIDQFYQTKHLEIIGVFI